MSMIADVRTALAELIATQPAAVGASIARVPQVLSSKSNPIGYWAEAGRSRFEREMRADGLDQALVEQVLSTVSAVLWPPVDLDAILAELRGRGA